MATYSDEHTPKVGERQLELAAGSEHSAQESSERGPKGEEPESSEVPWWTRQGYESEEHFWECLREDYAKDPLAAAVAGISVSPETAIPDVGVPELSEIPSAALERELSVRRGFRQVGIKLRPDDYDALASAAKAHGIAPTTLARILTARGARELADRGSPTPRSG